MNRRLFLRSLAGIPAGIVPFSRALAEESTAAGYDRLLVLVELRGGNDGLNTLIPYRDDIYYALRPRLALPRDHVLQLTESVALHPALETLMPLWKAKELAIVQGVGYPSPNLSHFRSIEIWDTASKSDDYMSDGWLARTFAATPVPRTFLAEGVVVSNVDLGPLSGSESRAITVANTEQFVKQARLAKTPAVQQGSNNKALAHLLKVEAEIVGAARNLKSSYSFKTNFPSGTFGAAIKTAGEVIANQARVAVVHISLSGFDTHRNQPEVHARLLSELATGLTALKAALIELGVWESSLIMTYSEFGRRPKENLSEGTDHGTAGVQFIIGGSIKGGLHGNAPSLSTLDGDGNLLHAVDFRSLYATILEKWWGVSSSVVLGDRFPVLDLIRA